MLPQCASRALSNLVDSYFVANCLQPRSPALLHGRPVVLGLNVGRPRIMSSGDAAGSRRGFRCELVGWRPRRLGQGAEPALKSAAARENIALEGIRLICEPAPTSTLPCPPVRGASSWIF